MPTKDLQERIFYLETLVAELESENEAMRKALNTGTRSAWKTPERLRYLQTHYPTKEEKEKIYLTTAKLPGPGIPAWTSFFRALSYDLGLKRQGQEREAPPPSEMAPLPPGLPRVTKDGAPSVAAKLEPVEVEQVRWPDVVNWWVENGKDRAESRGKGELLELVNKKREELGLPCWKVR